MRAIRKKGTNLYWGGVCDGMIRWVDPTKSPRHPIIKFPDALPNGRRGTFELEFRLQLLEEDLKLVWKLQHAEGDRTAVEVVPAP